MIIVSKDGSGQFSTVQDALNSIPENNSVEIQIYIKMVYIKKNYLY